MWDFPPFFFFFSVKRRRGQWQRTRGASTRSRFYHPAVPRTQRGRRQAEFNEIKVPGFPFFIFKHFLLPASVTGTDEA